MRAIYEDKQRSEESRAGSCSEFAILSPHNQLRRGTPPQGLNIPNARRRHPFRHGFIYPKPTSPIPCFSTPRPYPLQHPETPFERERG